MPQYTIVCVDMLEMTRPKWRDHYPDWKAGNDVAELRGVVGCLLLWLRGHVSQLLPFVLQQSLVTLLPCMLVSISLALPS